MFAVLGVLGTKLGEVEGQSSCHVTSRLALIGGTSTCHMAVSSIMNYNTFWLITG